MRLSGVTLTDADVLIDAGPPQPDAGGAGRCARPREERGRQHRHRSAVGQEPPAGRRPPGRDGAGSARARHRARRQPSGSAVRRRAAAGRTGQVHRGVRSGWSGGRGAAGRAAVGGGGRHPHHDCCRRCSPTSVDSRSRSCSSVTIRARSRPWRVVGWPSSRAGCCRAESRPWSESARVEGRWAGESRPWSETCAGLAVGWRKPSVVGKRALGRSGRWRKPSMVGNVRWGGSGAGESRPWSDERAPVGLDPATRHLPTTRAYSRLKASAAAPSRPAVSRIAGRTSRSTT